MSNLKKYTLLGGLFLLSLGPLVGRLWPASTGVPAPSSFLTGSELLDGWESHYGTIRTMSVSYTERVLSAKAAETDPNFLDRLVMIEHVERVEDGMRYHIRYSTAESGFADSKSVMEHAFDGACTAEYWGMEKLGTLERGLTGRNVERMNSLKHYLLSSPVASPVYAKEFPNGIPLFSFLLRELAATTSVRPILERVAGNWCHVIEIVDKNTRTDSKLETDNQFKIWVAHEKGFLPLKYQRYKNGRLAQEIVVQDISSAETETGRTWYPVKAQRTTQSQKRGKITYQFETHAFAPNLKVDKNSFRFDFPNGTRVVDRIMGVSYVVGVGDYAEEIPLVHLLQAHESGSGLEKEGHGTSHRGQKRFAEEKKNAQLAARQEEARLARKRFQELKDNTVVAEADSKHIRAKTFLALMTGLLITFILFLLLRSKTRSQGTEDG